MSLSFFASDSEQTSNLYFLTCCCGNFWRNTLANVVEKSCAEFCELFTLLCKG